jgi:Fe2+ transport system protein FeoA
MCLSDLRRGQYATVTHIPDDSLRMQLLRFGITAGCKVRCHTKLPFGPVVLKYGGQEIAVGRRVARRVGIASSCDALASRADRHSGAHK